MMNPGDIDKEETVKPFQPASRQNPYKFTPEEIRVIKDCNRESFFQRCLPLSAIMGAGAYLGVQNGYLRPSPKFGAKPKVIVAAIVGYFIGKFSYQKKCAEKLMQLPNSPIGEMLRQRRRGNLQESMDAGFGPGMSLAPFSSVNPNETYSDLGPGSSLDMDTSRPQNEGLDDSHRPSMDNPIYEEEMPPVQKHVTTYEELRKKNREEYQQKRTGVFRDIPKAAPSPPSSGQQSKQTSDQESFGPGVRRNAYGDPME